MAIICNNYTFIVIYLVGGHIQSVPLQELNTFSLLRLTKGYSRLLIIPIQFFLLLYVRYIGQKFVVMLVSLHYIFFI